MGLLSELRYPSKWYAKLVAGVLAFVLFALLATATIAGFLLYRIISPSQGTAQIDVKNFPGHPEVLKFEVPGVGEREGWFFPGLTTAPTILIGPGYQSNRGELLTLASALQDHQYNVLLFDLAAEGGRGYTTLGYRETLILRAALAAVSGRSDVDSSRFGLWGTNLSAYAALATAELEPRVRALVLEAVYDHPAEMLHLQVERSGLGNIPLMSRFARLGFRWLNYKDRRTPPLSRSLGRLAGVPKLFIEPGDDAELALATRQIFLQAPQPRELVMLAKGDYASMLDGEKRSYENRMVSFFLLNLPAVRAPRR